MARRPSRIVSAVVGLLTGNSPRPSAVVADALGTAREDLAAREADLDATRAAYDAALDEGREAALAARARLSEAEVDADIARRQVAKLEAEAEQAREAERRAETDRAVAEAEAAIEAYRTAAVEDWPAIVAAIRGILRLRAEAEIANNAARTAIAADPEPGRHAPRTGVDHFRNRQGRPRKVIGEPREIELWTNGRGEPLGDDAQARMRVQSDGSGLLRSEHTSMKFEHKRLFRQVRYLPAEMSEAPDDLIRSVRIPGLVAGDPPGWTPGDRDPVTILRLLDELEAAQPVEDRPDTRQPRIDLEPLGRHYEVVRRNDGQPPAGQPHDDEAA